MIIPTTCESQREGLLSRALGSVLAQQGVEFKIIVVVNGKLFDRVLLDRLKQDRRLQTLQIDEAHVARARLHGVRESMTEFISFLDDDDEFLPDALRLRVRAMRACPDADVVVTNGYFVNETGADLLHIDPDFAKSIKDDELESFLARNWFASPASVFRRSTVGADFFELPYKYFEWTYLFFALISAGRKIEYCDAITYRKYENHALSISKSESYLVTPPTFLLDLLALPLDPRVQSAVKVMYRRHLSGLCGHHLHRGDLRAAWRIFVKRLLNGDWTATSHLPSFARRLLHMSKHSASHSTASARVTAVERDACDKAVTQRKEQ